ncbi:hypothetical protein ACFYZT_32255 [Streptomyces sp. NPDC001591]|uniref:hypothetical protein n=1 Tax=Streptomyces sp. NPDC001591 TaxID=3364589 RepID=UPI0036A2FF24
MADIWVMGTTMQAGRSGPLVRADAITHLIASTEKVTASRLGSEDVITLVHRDSVGHGYDGSHDVPDDFHVALLHALTEARGKAQGSAEDLVLFPDLDDNRKWQWSIIQISELWSG